MRATEHDIMYGRGGGADLWGLTLEGVCSIGEKSRHCMETDKETGHTHTHTHTHAHNMHACTHARTHTHTHTHTPP